MILDFVFIFLFLIICVIGYKRGFGAMALAFSAFLISLLITYLLYNPIYNFIQKSEIGEKIEHNISEYILQSINDKADESIKKIDIPVFIKKDVNGIIPVDEAAQKALKVLTTVFSIVISYFAARIVLSLIKRIIKSVTSIPLIHFADSVLGMLLGALTGIIWCALLYYTLGYLTLIPSMKFINNQYYSSITVTVISDFLI